MKRIAAATTTALTLSTATAFTQNKLPTFVSSKRSSNMPLQMGLFDGMKDAFSAPNTSSIDAERETPIDRWMGWNVKSGEEQQRVASSKFRRFEIFLRLICHCNHPLTFTFCFYLHLIYLLSIYEIAPDNFVDSMEKGNYVEAKLVKPMGIVFEENDEEFGGIFVISLSEDGAAEKEGTVKPGDQLVAVNDNKVAGMPFDEALGCIVDATTDETRLTFFRGTEKQLYGPTGASNEWLDEFIAESHVQA